MRRRDIFFNQRPEFLKKLVAYFPFNYDMKDKIKPLYGTPTPNNVVLDSLGKLGGCVVSEDSSVANNIRYTTGEPGALGKFSFTDGVVDLPFSISFWMYVSDYYVNARHILGYNGLGGSGNNHSYSMWITPTGNIRFTKYSEGIRTSTKTLTSDSIISKNQWVNIVYTDNVGDNMKFYINSVLQTGSIVNSGAAYIKMKPGNSRFGFMNTQGVPSIAAKFIGKIEDVGLFNTLLVQKDINFIYKGGLGKELR